MDDHHQTLRAYDRAQRLRLIGTLFVSALVLLAGAMAWTSSDGWRSRYERVFEPLPGLLYAAPAQDVSLTTEDNPVPLAFQPIDRSDAYRYNASIPVSNEPLEPALPFVLPAGLSAADRTRALACLTQAIYYEAGSESVAGQRAVAQVVLNRMRHPAFPSSVCGVVYSGSQRATGCQFTFTCDGSLARPPSSGGWARARQVALAALSGYVDASVGQATHYHALYVAPYWSPSLLKVANIGAHTFYRWKGLNGKRRAFVSAYAGREPVVSGRIPVEEAASETAAIEVPDPEPAAGGLVVAVPEAPAVTVPSPPAAAPLASPPANAPTSAPARETAPAVESATPAPATAVTTAPVDRPRRRVALPSW